MQQAVVPNEPYGYAPFSQPIAQVPLSAQLGPVAVQSNWSPMAASMATAAPIGTQQGSIALRRAFAGHGARLVHYSWLLPQQQKQAEQLSSTIAQKLFQCNVPGVTVKAEKLMERGVLSEEREYIKVSRGASTVFIYTAPAGQDLYVSRATTVLPPVTSVRIVIFSLLLLVTIFGPALVRGIVESSATDTSAFGAFGAAASAAIAGGLVTVFVSYPLYIFFGYLLVRSIVTWLFENDFWWFLRPNTLNDFQLDDIALLEHVTDEVLQHAAYDLGLDGSKITAPAQGYQQKRRIRLL
jgi:hypothetical protein